MLLVIAALLVVGLVGFLFFSPCGVTIEKFQDAPAESAFVPPVVEKPPPPMPVKGFKDSSPPPSTPLAPPPRTPVPSFCGKYGYPSPDNSIRLYTAKECSSILGGLWSENGECLKKDGGSFSYECRDLNGVSVAAQPIPQALPQALPQPGVSAIQSMMPPPPPPPAFVPPVVEEPQPPASAGFKQPSRIPTQFQQAPQPITSPTPVAPTPASSAAALTLTPVQCSSLCPVTQETCESKFSCQTRLAPIGTTPLTTNSTPAEITTAV